MDSPAPWLVMLHGWCNSLRPASLPRRRLSSAGTRPKCCTEPGHQGIQTQGEGGIGVVVPCRIPAAGDGGAEVGRLGLQLSRGKNVRGCIDLIGGAVNEG